MRFEIHGSFFELGLFTQKKIFKDNKKTYPFSVYRLSGKNLFINISIYIFVPFDERFFYTFVINLEKSFLFFLVVNSYFLVTKIKSELVFYFACYYKLILFLIDPNFTD